MFDAELISMLFRCYARSAWLLSMAFDEAADSLSTGFDARLEWLQDFADDRSL